MGMCHLRLIEPPANSSYCRKALATQAHTPTCPLGETQLVTQSSGSRAGVASRLLAPEKRVN